MLQAREAHTLTNTSRARLERVRLAHLLELAEQGIRAAIAKGEYSCLVENGEQFNDHAFVQSMQEAGYKLEWPRRSKALVIIWGHAQP